MKPPLEQELLKAQINRTAIKKLTVEPKQVVRPLVGEQETSMMTLNITSTARKLTKLMLSSNLL